MECIMHTKSVVALSLLTLVSIPVGRPQALQDGKAEDARLVDIVKPVSGVKPSGETSGPAIANRNTVVNTTVQVNAGSQSIAVDRNAPAPFHASSAEVMSSAGTYGDSSRYLQLFPGVVFNTDESDDILVRGGNPIENLYLVDGIEVPNINHIATEASTGGLVSMIDTTAVDDVDLRTGGYDASYEERLSSVVDIHTREIRMRERHTEMDVGFVGAGGVTESPLAKGGSLLISAHRSLLNLFTNNVGLNGVPIYTNGLVSARRKLGPKDDLALMGLGGIDSIDIKPQALDWDETNTIQTQYSGWRGTMGLRWQHIFSVHAVGNLTISDSEQHANINQQDQFLNHDVPGEHSPLSYVPTPIYSELTHDGTTNLRYDDYLAVGSKLIVISGVALHAYRIDDHISQPEGQQSVLSSDPTHTDATSFAPNLATQEKGGYAEATWHILPRWSISGGGRAELFLFGGGHGSITPRLNSVFLLSSHIGVHASFGEYAQLPSFIYLTSWPQNHSLNPIRARHIVAGLGFSNSHSDKFGIDVYQKNYRDYPVSTEYLTLSLANMVDTLGQQFLWLPLVSRGTGVTRGIELFGQAHLGAHIFGQANVAYARAEYAALDDVLRRGNFDYPIVANCAGIYRSGKRYEASWRYEYSTGRPYTPYLLDESAAQDRPIYDVRQINALRGPAYSRLDIQFDRTFFIDSHRLTAYTGLENVFDRKNFLGYYWMPRLGALGGCSSNPERCVSPQHQMSRFPNFGVRYAF
jgi:hypothetical protein